MGDQRFSGRFLLRIESGLHASLRGAADAAGLSLNEYCARKLAAPGPPPGEIGALVSVQAAAEIAGKALLGVVAFGSWARAEQGPDSDVDVLIVLADTQPITRELYRRWDAAPRSWNDHPVEPHFVHLPPATRPGAGVWAEAAIDGIVLFERRMQVSRRLAGVRTEIAHGRIQRRHVAGHAYWVEAA